jgi:hypothetical protein
MRAAQFVKGKIWDEEKQDSYEQTFESSGIETFLSYEKYMQLRTQKYVIAEPKQKYWKAEHVFSVITVKEADHVDSAGRGGLVVQGFLVDITPQSRYDGFPIQLNDEVMLEDVYADKWRLKMPPFPALEYIINGDGKRKNKPLEIPAIEWEAHP